MIALKKLFITNFLFISLIIFGQHKTAHYNHEQLEIFLKAEEHFENHEFFSALSLYKKLDSLTGRYEHNYEIGVCLFGTRHWDEAQKIFTEIIEKKHEYPSELDFYWAVLMHYQHDFVEANKYYSNYLSRLNHSKLHYEEIVKDIKHRMYQCEIGSEFIQKKRAVKVHDLGDEVNSKYLDYAPIWDEKNKLLIFTSERPTTTGGKIDLTDGTYNEDVYVVTHSDALSWGKPAKIKGDLDTESNESALSISPSGNKVLVYKYVQAHFYSHGSGEIYEGDYFGDSITNLKPLPKPVNSNAWESGATYISENEIILCTDRKGGFGSSDLYYCKRKKNGDWTEPQNLGETINTEFEEDSPYVTNDGKYLFFSSKGHNSIGGFDIFYSQKLADGSWGAPINLGYPINTAHDEMYFSISEDLKSMYLSSDRIGGKGDQDVYYLIMEEGTFIK